MKKICFGLILMLAAVSIFAQGYSSKFVPEELSYKEDIKKITITIPKEKAVAQTAKIQFLDAANGESLTWQENIELKDGKTSYTIKNFPSGNLWGIPFTREEDFLNAASYQWKIHIRLIFADGTSYVFKDSYCSLNAKLINAPSYNAGEISWEIRGPLTVEKEGFSFKLPYGYKKFNVMQHMLFTGQKESADVYCPVSYSFTKEFAQSNDIKEIVSVGRFSVTEFSNHYENIDSFLEEFYKYLLKLYEVKRIPMEALETKKGLACLKYNIKLNNNTNHTLYLFYQNGYCTYVHAQQKIKTSSIDELLNSILNTMELK